MTWTSDPRHDYAEEMSENGKGRSGIDVAAAKLRKLILSRENGSFLGNEDALMGTLGASRNTLRQIARILEREGLLQVRRGISGGYYAVRPDLATIEAAVTGYLHSLDVRVEDATMIASVLWVQSLQRAAAAPSEALQPLVEEFTVRLGKVPEEASFADIVEFEAAFRGEIFELVDSPYIQLIFQINGAFALSCQMLTADPDGAGLQQAFAREWRKAKTLELVALRDGDSELAAIAARRARQVWDKHVLTQHPAGLRTTKAISTSR